MKLSRRGFLRVVGITGSTALAVGASRAQASAGAASLDTVGANETGMLVDTTLCAGCRACEAACAESNKLPAPPAGEAVLESRRETGPQVFTIVNKFEGPQKGEDRFVKRQCMHCVEPGCASVCPVRAIDKTPEGPVVYKGERCMGCRYCMVACPFSIPKYEYDALAPLVRKCTFCAERQKEGKKPACAEVCPTGALTFGKRGTLLELAKQRIYKSPEKYVHHVYGEHEAGGTNWLYLSDVDFRKLDFAQVDDHSYPGKVQGALGAPPFVMTLWPPLLMGMYAFSRRRKELAKGEPADDHSNPLADRSQDHE